MIKNYNPAFTLAEVLITLSIVGVIAALTIPSLLQSINSKDTVVQVKKAYTVFSQALERATTDNGTVDTWGCTTASCYFNNLTPYLSVVQNCGLATGQGCFPTGITYQKISGGNQFNVDGNGGYPKARLEDGMSFITDGMDFPSTNCNLSKTSNASNLALNNVCAAIFVDINGNKGPNTCGEDFFAFWITKYGLVPFGTQDDTGNPLLTDCSNKSGSGYGCTAWVLYKENTDYMNGAVSW